MSSDRPGANAVSRLDLVLWVVVALLLLRSLQMLTGGLIAPWTDNTDIDLQLRAFEYEVFRQGIYPNANLVPQLERELRQYSVYPPYAFPMMVPLFEPGGVLQARVIIAVTSIASLAVLAVGAWKVMRPWGIPAAAAVALIPFATTGNKFVFVLGQFSLWCMALVFIQMWLIRRNRPLAAGACWALAMLKPQIALPFGLLFLLRGQIRGLGLGLAMLALLSGIACAWTELTPWRVLRFWAFDMTYSFSEDGFGLGPGTLASWLGVDHRAVQVVMAVALAVVGVLVFRFLRRRGHESMLPIAGLLGGLGMVFFYHRLYDVAMLFPAVLATFLVAASGRNRWALAIGTVTTATFLLPNRRIIPGPFVEEIVLAALWLSAAILPVILMLREERQPKGATA